MGIRGLTTFINNRSHLYLKDYELHDCNVVIDGNSLASNLYNWYCKSNDCFGGDYDKYARVVHNFFEQLDQCGIFPYVILDGGYETRKLKTVYSRMQKKIWAADSLDASTEGSVAVFPLFLREVFVDVVVTLGLRVARCEFEADMEIAAIAKMRDCPVISYDSDFYVSGCLYIPFNKVDITPRKGKDKSTKAPYTYLSCQIYHIENFLEAYGGLDKNNLPLLSVLLGNDYISGTMFAPFFKNLKIQKCNGNQSDQQKRIKSIIIWLQNENIESAIKAVLSRFKYAKRQLILKKIQQAMTAYHEVNDNLLRYLGIVQPNPIDFQVDFDKLKNEEHGSIEEVEESDESGNRSVNGSDSENEQSPPEPKVNVLPQTFQGYYRSCQYPACFMDMVSLHRYYCIPQVEERSGEHSHKISLELLGIMYDILTPSGLRCLNIYYRDNREIRHTHLPRLCNRNFPTLVDIEKFSFKERELVLLHILSAGNTFDEVLKQFPHEWHLFLIALNYAICKGQFDRSLIYSCLICFIILNYVDVKIGFHRISRTFEKKFAESLTKIKATPSKTEFVHFDQLPFGECLVFMDKVIAFFQMDTKLKANNRLYDKTLVHSLAQLQSVFLHVKYLNSIFNHPFVVLKIHKFFNGTFIYNMTTCLRKRSDINEYFEQRFKECPCILGCIKHVLNALHSILNNTTINVQMGKKNRKKKKKVQSNEEYMEKCVEDEDGEELIDPNNPYSILAIL